MDHSQLKTQIIHDVTNHGICAKGLYIVKTSDIDALVDYYTQNPDWCMERSFPDLDTLSRAFSGYEAKGVFVNKSFHGETISGLQAYIFHNCTGSINVELSFANGTIPMLYFANGCRMEITCRQKENRGFPIRVPLYVFGENNVRARDNDYATFSCHKHSLL